MLRALRIIGWIVFGLVALLGVAVAVLRYLIWRGGRGVQPTHIAEKIITPTELATVTRTADGDLCVTWAPSASRVRVRVLESLDAAQSVPLSVPPQQTSVTFTPPDANRRYAFDVSFSGGEHDGETVRVTERLLPLEDGINLRDAGGYATDDGQWVRWGRIYRSGELNTLTERDLNRLTELGINVVCDLRTHKEFAERAGRVPTGITLKHTPVIDEINTNRYLNMVLFQRNQLSTRLGEGYIMLLQSRPQVYAAVIGEFATPGVGVLYHCTAGKDRTGITTALLLSVLGVPRETIVADYSLSNLVFEQQKARLAHDLASLTRFGIPLAQLDALSLVEPAWINQALDWVDHTYGSAANYLMQAGGMSEVTLQRVRENLLIRY